MVDRCNAEAETCVCPFLEELLELIVMQMFGRFYHRFLVSHDGKKWDEVVYLPT